MPPLTKYAAMTNSDHALWKSHGTAAKRDLETLQLFGVSQFRPLLLAALDCLSADQIPKLMRLLEVLSIRYSSICSLGPGNIEKAYSDAAISARAGKANTTAKLFA